MKNKHQKHNKFKRPMIGNYHNNEWSIYGSTCDQINSFFNDIQQEIPFSGCFIDANHGDIEFESFQQYGKKQFKTKQNILWNSFDDQFNSELYDYVIVNGNHYPCSKQIVIINPKKKESLERRKHELNNIEYIITDDRKDIYPFLWNIITENTKIITGNSIELFLNSFIQNLHDSSPEIYALILAGGKSTRMGRDKSKMTYHDKTQEVHLAEICNALNLKTYISKSNTKTKERSISNFPVITDTFCDMGPMGAILSAFRKHPDKAWLVLACDLPLIRSNDIRKLLNSRNISKYASAYIKEEGAFPEPLAGIYEPRAYKRLLEFLSLGYSCPRKMLINSDIEEILPDEAKILMNANSPTDAQEINRILNGK